MAKASKFEFISGPDSLEKPSFLSISTSGLPSPSIVLIRFSLFSVLKFDFKFSRQNQGFVSGAFLSVPVHSRLRPQTLPRTFPPFHLFASLARSFGSTTRSFSMQIAFPLLTPTKTLLSLILKNDIKQINSYGVGRRQKTSKTLTAICLVRLAPK
jgi:hypothetical protein